jgi:hypothetical protein
MRSVRIALAAGLAITATAVGGVLAGAPPTILATNGVPAKEGVAVGWRGANGCQTGERLPRATTAIRLALAGAYGPRVHVEVLGRGLVLTSGEQSSGWAGKSVTVPVRALPTAQASVAVCFSAAVNHEGVSVGGAVTQPGAALQSAGRPLRGRMNIEYLGNGRSSWLALAGSVARHMSLGRAWSGIWVVFLVTAAMLLATALTARLVLVELGSRSAKAPESADAPQTGLRSGLRAAIGRVPRAALVCAAVACLNGIGWAFITPPFEAPDEPSHFAYVKQLAETGTPPTSGGFDFSREEQYAIAALRSETIHLDPTIPAIFTQAEQRKLDRELAAFNHAHERKGSPEAGSAEAEPPLYYALEALPYKLGASGTLLDRLQLMRLLSALMAGATALFAFLFVREALPRVRWAWSVGGLATALSPLFGFVSGTLNPDALLFTVSAALFYCLARAFRRGLGARSAAATGLVIAAGFATKLNFAGLAPGALVALGILALRARRSHRLRALAAPVAAAFVGISPIAVFLARNLLTGRSALGIATSTLGTMHGTALEGASYVWQLYLPRLPGMVNDLPGLPTTREIWFDGYVGRFGWLDTTFPDWVYTLALVPATLILALCARTLWVRRAALRGRLPELACYVLMALGLMVLVGVSSYGEFPALTAGFGQARYLLPLLPLLAAVLVLAARGAGRRWGPVVGTLIVVLFLAQDIFGQLQTVARFYV